MGDGLRWATNFVPVPCSTFIYSHSLNVVWYHDSSDNQGYIALVSYFYEVFSVFFLTDSSPSVAPPSPQPSPTAPPTAGGKYFFIFYCKNYWAAITLLLLGYMVWASNLVWARIYYCLFNNIFVVPLLKRFNG